MKRVLLAQTAVVAALALFAMGCETTTGTGGGDTGGADTADTGGGEVSGDDTSSGGTDAATGTDGATGPDVDETPDGVAGSDATGGSDSTGGSDAVGGTDDTGSDADEPVDCAALAPDACALAPDCLVISGAPSSEVCDGNYDNWLTVPAGCMSADGGCGGAETCAEDPDTGERLTFSSTCIPTGWTALDNETCCETIEPIDCAEQDVGSCEQEAKCAVISGMPTDAACGDGGGTPEPVGCMDVATGCDDALTCGQSAAGVRLVFPDSCLPDGWIEQPWQACCTPDPVICSELTQDGCDAEPMCTQAFGYEPDGWCPEGADGGSVTYAGCMLAGTPCAPMLTCAQDADTGKALIIDGCLPGGWNPVDMSVCCSDGPKACADLDPDACANANGCAVLSGAPFQDWCAEDFSTWMSVPAGCMDVGFGCGDAETCGEDPETGQRLVFPSTCLPEGWVSVDYEACCSDVPAEWTHCNAASDCEIVELGCCDHCNGGWAQSVNSDYAEQLESTFGATGCEDVFCTLLACAPLYATCDAGTCGQSEEPPPPSCADLDESGCYQDPSCAPIYGEWPWCDAPGGVSGDVALFYGGCMDANMGCGDFPTCAMDPTTGQLIQFWDTCIPQGWQPVETCCPETAVCEEGSETPIAQVCVRGEMGDSGESLTAGGMAQIQLYPEGCFSSSCTIIYEASCATELFPADGGGGVLTVDGLFCHGATGDQACTADCSGGGWAECSSESLAAGVYTASVDGLSVSFEVPSQLPFGGVCAGSPF